MWSDGAALHENGESGSRGSADKHTLPGTGSRSRDGCASRRCGVPESATADAALRSAGAALHTSEPQRLSEWPMPTVSLALDKLDFFTGFAVDEFLHEVALVDAWGRCLCVDDLPATAALHEDGASGSRGSADKNTLPGTGSRPRDGCASRRCGVTESATAGAALRSAGAASQADGEGGSRGSVGQ